MVQPTDVNLTLPSVVASLPGQYSQQALVLTIIFHPSIHRIGERTLLPPRNGRETGVLGRLGPEFYRGNTGSGSPLEDRHVSRRALVFSWDGDVLVIERPADASRCRALGRELDESLRLDGAQLRRGVPLMLGHRLVLLLRHSRSYIADTPVEGDLGLRGGSAAMASLRAQIAQVAQNDGDVLIRGETGSGKELVGQAIHAASRRAEQPLVSVNMAAIPAELAPAALFGSAKGAFTGADRAVPGYFEQAEGGSLFLDEVGDMPSEIQPQLLRALQQREIQSVGGTIRKVDLRVISATDVSLDGTDSGFKAALRHRLGAVEILLLPLREHPEDIGELALHWFIAYDRAGTGRGLLPGEQGSEFETAGWSELFYRFLLYSWPGNVRELGNVCRQVAVASENALTVPEHIRATLVAARRDKTGEEAHSTCRLMRDIPPSEFDRAWEGSRFEPAGTARLLQVSRQSVYRRVGGSPGYRLATDVQLDELRGVLLDCRGDSGQAAAILRVSLNGLRAVLRNSALDWH